MQLPTSKVELQKISQEVQAKLNKIYSEEKQNEERKIRKEKEELAKKLTKTKAFRKFKKLVGTKVSRKVSLKIDFTLEMTPDISSYGIGLEPEIKNIKTNTKNSAFLEHVKDTIEGSCNQILLAHPELLELFNLKKKFDILDYEDKSSIAYEVNHENQD